MIEYKPSIADALTFFGYTGFSCNTYPASEDEFNFQSCNETVLTHSWSQLKTKWDELITEWEAQEYARNRQAEFPSIQDLVVALYDTDDKSAIETKRASVKAKYPKPE